MTLDEKIGQMTQVQNSSITPQQITDFFIGSILNGGDGDLANKQPKKWIEDTTAHQRAALATRLQIPLVYGVDAVHGNNGCNGATIFPHNIGLGATRDEKLMYEVGKVTALEVLATGCHWDFAPAVSVPHDIRWGRIYEGYSESTDIVVQHAIPYVKGLQDNGIVATIKHFIADGGTGWQSYFICPWDWKDNSTYWSSFVIDQGNSNIDEATLRKVHLPPYIAGIEAGVMTIMASFSSWNGHKMHGNRYLLTDVLKDELGFKGFIISDWQAIDYLHEDYYRCVVDSINAGIDMVMVPDDFEGFIANLRLAVKKGDVPESRIDDAVARILTVKYQIGLFDRPYGDPSLLNLIGCDAHRAVAREAVRKSMVLLKNEHNVLPLSTSGDYKLIVGGVGADNIGLQCGGWTTCWQGNYGAITAGTSLWEAMQKERDSKYLCYAPDAEFNAEFLAGDSEVIGIYVAAEKPYAEGFGDMEDVRLCSGDCVLIHKMKRQCSKLILITFSGRPLILSETVLAEVDGLIAAWLPGTEGAGITDVLFGHYPFTGKLSVSYPRTPQDLPLSALKANPDGALFPVGFGL